MTQTQAREILETGVADPTFTVGKLIERVKTDQALKKEFEKGEDITSLDAIVTLIIFDNREFEKDYNGVHYGPTGSGINAYGRNGINAMLDIQDKNIRKDYWDWWVKFGYLHTMDFPITESTSVKDLIQEAVNFSHYCQADKLKVNKPGGRFLDYFEDKFHIGCTAIQDIAQMTITEAVKTSAKKCVVFTGAPGTGKTYCVEQYVNGQKQMEAFDRKEYFVQFHSSYDYTDFVEGLRPIKINGKMEFERMDGIFKAFCRKVVALGGEKKYYFVIDEINRADLGRVFGELMYCFEKRGEEHRIAMQYANLDTYDEKGQIIDAKDDCFKGGFYIPENVVIIGTMNDIDRSVETFDFALRRRFDWVEIKADEVMDSSLRAIMEHLLEEEKKTDEAKVRSFVDALVDDILPRITKMNKIIGDKEHSSLGEEYKIGHAYFKDYDAKTGFSLYDEKSGLNQENHKENLNAIWDHNIAPILREYMRGRLKAGQFVIDCGVALGVLPPPKKKSEPDSPQRSGDGADAQPGEQK